MRGAEGATIGPGFTVHARCSHSCVVNYANQALYALHHRILIHLTDYQVFPRIQKLQDEGELGINEVARMASDRSEQLLDVQAVLGTLGFAKASMFERFNCQDVCRLVVRRAARLTAARVQTPPPALPYPPIVPVVPPL